LQSNHQCPNASKFSIQHPRWKSNRANITNNPRHPSTFLTKVRKCTNIHSRITLIIMIIITQWQIPINRTDTSTPLKPLTLHPQFLAITLPCNILLLCSLRLQYLSFLCKRIGMENGLRCGVVVNKVLKMFQTVAIQKGNSVSQRICNFEPLAPMWSRKWHPLKKILLPQSKHFGNIRKSLLRIKKTGVRKVQINYIVSRSELGATQAFCPTSKRIWNSPSNFDPGDCGSLTTSFSTFKASVTLFLSKGIAHSVSSCGGA